MDGRLETKSGYVNEGRVGVGAYAKSKPLSSLEAFQHAQERDSRILTPSERLRSMEIAENQYQEALKSGTPEKIQEAENLLLDSYGINIGTPGYAGARDLTATVMDFKQKSVKEVNGVVGSNLYGPESHHRWFSQLEKDARELQAKGLTAYIKRFDNDTGLVIEVSDEPNPEYHGATLFISPDVRDLGVVVMGPNHSFGDSRTKYDTAILPLDYKDIMLGPRMVSDTDRLLEHRTSNVPNWTKLAAAAGISDAFIGELADKTLRGRISQEEAIKKVASYLENSNGKNHKLSRRHWLQTAGMLFGLATITAIESGCGGGSSGGGGPPPPPPPEQKYEYSGSVAKRIANDGSKANIGEVVLDGSRGTFKADIDSAGNFKVTGIPAGTYRRTTRHSGDSFVPQVEPNILIGSNLTGQNYSVIERGDNRFGVPFDANFQEFYNKLAQRSGVGIFKWGNASGQAPQKIVMKASTIPADVQAAFKNSVDFVSTRDTPTFSGGRLISLPSEFRETPGDYEIEMSMWSGSTGTTLPLTDGKRIVRARTLFDVRIADTLRQGGNPDFTFAHEYGHDYGADDFQDANFDSIMNGLLAKNPKVTTINDQLTFFLLNHPYALPGNISPDINP
ncbi:MAG: hypothetical protein AABX79_00540 [Nanoarchaeota archaeon]